MTFEQPGTPLVPPVGTRLDMRLGARAPAWEPVLVAGGLTAYNLALNGVPFPAWSYVPLNVALAGAVAYGAHRRWGVDPHAMGLSRACVRPGLRTGGLVGAATGVLAALAPSVTALRPLLADRRAGGMTGRALAYQAFVRIPLGTALAEEVLFRGVLPAVWRRSYPPAGAELASAASFGGWHVGPALAVLRANDIELSALGRAAAVGATVVGTAGAGLLLAFLRRRGRGLLAPIVAHAACNGLSLWAAARFQRRHDPSG